MRPRTGQGDGTAYDAWRMDQMQMYLTWNDPDRTAYNRSDPEQGIYKTFVPGTYMTTRPDTALGVANRAVKQGTNPRHNGKAAIFNVPNDAVYIEFMDTIWSELIEGKPDFGPATIDTLIINGEANDADGVTNRRDYRLNISTTSSNGFTLATMPEWTKIVLKGGSVSAQNVQARPELNIFPNPNSTGVLHLSREADVTIYNMAGQQMLRSSNSSRMDISGLKAGIYMVKDNEGNVKKLMKK